MQQQIAAVCGPLPSKPQEDPEVANAVNPSAGSPRLRDLVDSLQTISDLEWKAVFCEIDLSEKILRQDRAGTYARMDFASREAYRSVVSELAKGSKRAEHEVATQAIDLARQQGGRLTLQDLVASGHSVEIAQQTFDVIQEKGLARQQPTDSLSLLLGQH